MSATTDPLDRRTHFQKERKESYALLAVELPEEPESDSSSSSSSSSSLSVSACEAAKANAELEADVVGAAAPLAPTPASAAAPTISSRGSITKLVHLDFEWESSLASEDGAKSPAEAAAAAGTVHFHTPTWGGSGNCNTRRSANRRRARIQRISNLSEITSSFNSDADFSDLGDDFGNDLVVVTEEDGDEKSGGADVYEVIIAKPQRNKEGGKTNNNDTFHKNYNLAPKSKSIRKNSSSSSSSSDRRMSATPAQIAMAIDALLMQDNNDEVHTGGWDDRGKDTRKSRASLASLESIENFARRNSILRKIPVAGSETGNVGDYGGNRDDYGNVKTGEKDEEREVFDSLRVLLGNDAYLLDYDSSDDDDYNDNDETDERNTNDVNHPISTTSEEEELQKMIKLVNKSQRDSLSLARTKLYQHREQHRHEQQQHQLCRQNIQHRANCLEGNESENHHHRDDDISKADALVQTSFSSNKKLVATTVIDDDDCFDCDHDGNNIFNNQRECKNDHIRKSTKIINNKNNDENISKKNNNKGRISLPMMSRVSIVLQQMFGDEIDVIASNDDKNDGDGGKGGNVGVGKKKGSRRENTRLYGCNHTFASQDNISCMDDDVVIDDDGDDDDDDQDLIVTWRK